MSDRNDKYQKYGLDHKQNAKHVNTSRSDNYRPTHVGAQNPSAYEKYFTLFLKYSFYAVLMVLFSFVLLIVLNTLGFKTFSFLPDDGGLIEIPLLPTNRQVVFPNRIMASDASANLLNLNPYNYTMSVDVFIDSDFVNQSVPRVILYRAPEAVTLTSADKTIDIISAKMPQSNFILYLDPYTNDLMADVFVVSNKNMDSPSTQIVGPSGSPSGPSGRPSGQSGSLPAKKISMPRIENVPIRTPFRVTVMLSDLVLEVYINGELEKSQPLIGGIPRATTSQFYGPPAIVGQSVQVSNISYWNTSLSSKSIRVYGKETLNSSVFTK